MYTDYTDYTEEDNNDESYYVETMITRIKKN